MRFYKLQPEYDASDNNLNAWVDDGTTLMDLNHNPMGAVAGVWPTDLSFPIGESDNTIGDVLFNPDCLIFSEFVRAALEPLPACFMLNQPIGSAAREGGFRIRGICFNEPVRLILERFCGVDFSLVFD